MTVAVGFDTSICGPGASRIAGSQSRLEGDTSGLWLTASEGSGRPPPSSGASSLQSCEGVEVCRLQPPGLWCFVLALRALAQLLHRQLRTLRPS